MFTFIHLCMYMYVLIGFDSAIDHHSTLPLFLRIRPQACAREPPPAVIYTLLTAYPDAVSSYHPLPVNGDPSVTAGALPLHYAAQWGASKEVINILVAAWPHALCVRDNRGFLAEDIAKLSKFPNREAVVHALEEGRLEYEAEKKRAEAVATKTIDAASEQDVLGKETLVPLNCSCDQTDFGDPADLLLHRNSSLPRVRSRMTINESGGNQSGNSTPSALSRSMSMDEGDPASTQNAIQEEGWRVGGLIIVIVGASGDLAKKKTFPSLLNLYDDNLLPDNVIFWGFARSGLSHDDLRARLRPYLLKSGDHDENVVGEFLSRCYYQQGKSYGDVDAFAALSKSMDVYESSFTKPEHNRLFYLAIPPNVFGDAAIAIKKTAMAPMGWSRVIVEKPFGRDLASCEELLSTMSRQFKESELFRIDHYLGKEMVQTIALLRFGNRWFERLFNRDDIQTVIITFKEPFGTDGRGGYFDDIGIIRDVVQNHLLQVLTLLAMEAPIKADGPEAGERIRDAKVAVLNAIAPVTLDEVLLGQYEGYADDPTIMDKNTNTPTFVAMRCFVRTPRWDGVPFIFKAGKALNERRAEVRIQFRDAPAAEFMFDAKLPRNELVLKIQPDESMYIKTNVKSPGFRSEPIQGELEVNYDQRWYENSSESQPDAYTRLILDVLRGRSSNFVRDDELKRAWEIFTPLLHQIEEEKVRPHIYKRGSRGPIAADAFITARSGYIRNTDYEYYDHKPSRKSKGRKSAGSFEVGVYGCAGIGTAFALNMASKGFKVLVGNRTQSKVQHVVQLAKEESIPTLGGSSSAEDFVKRLAKPRKVILLVMAGKPVNETIEMLSRFMESGDLIIDAGNENYADSIHHARSLGSKGIGFLDMFLSGGHSGARRGPCLMIGGSKELYDTVSDLFVSCSAEFKGTPCCAYVGSTGTANFLKSVHNGLEYAEEELIAEAYDVMKRGLNMSNEEVASIFSSWNEGDLASYLLNITSTILLRNDDLQANVIEGRNCLDVIRDKILSRNSGRRAAQDAAEHSVPTPSISAALDMRYLSSLKEERVAASEILEGPPPTIDLKGVSNKSELLECLRQAFYASKVCCFAQAFDLIRSTSNKMGWNINLSEVARTLRGGCIIRCRLLEKIHKTYEANPDLSNIMLATDFANFLNRNSDRWRTILLFCVNAGIPTSTLGSSLSYFDSYRRKSLPANLTQAHRDYFGGHTFERVDRDGIFHCKWTEAYKVIGDRAERKLGENLADQDFDLQDVPPQ